jgi:NADH-quinone oxidoreductase subunit J
MSGLLLLSQPTVTAELSSSGGGFSGPVFWWWVLAILTVGGAISTVTRRNNIAAVMSLVGTFFGLAAMYGMLSAHFLAVLQVLVYAGAIMTLFVFVIMVLNRDEAEPWAWSGVVSKLIGVFALVYFTVKVAFHLLTISPLHPDAPPADFGTVEQVGEILFKDYLFVFEAVSVLLLIAVVAAVVVARSKHPIAGPDEDEDETETPHVGHGDHHSEGH